LKQYFEGNIMKLRNAVIASLAVLTLAMTTGCAVTRDQESMGAYIDDSVITTSVKSRFFDDKTVDGTAVSVETLNGTVMLSGFAKNLTEKRNAEAIAMKVKGVKSVKNELLIRP
jgi:osmotically-inducible protein OsmY